MIANKKMIYTNTIYSGNSLEVLKSFPDECVDLIVTSPPYFGQRDYNVKNQIGQEKTVEEYINNLKITNLQECPG